MRRADGGGLIPIGVAGAAQAAPGNLDRAQRRRQGRRVDFLDAVAERNQANNAAVSPGVLSRRER